MHACGTPSLPAAPTGVTSEEGQLEWKGHEDLGHWPSDNSSTEGGGSAKEIDAQRACERRCGRSVMPAESGPP